MCQRDAVKELLCQCSAGDSVQLNCHLRQNVERTRALGECRIAPRHNTIGRKTRFSESEGMGCWGGETENWPPRKMASLEILGDGKLASSVGGYGHFVLGHFQAEKTLKTHSRKTTDNKNSNKVIQGFEILLQKKKRILDLELI